MWNGFDAYKYLYSCSHHPEDGHTSGRNMATTV